MFNTSIAMIFLEALKKAENMSHFALFNTFIFKFDDRVIGVRKELLANFVLLTD